MASNASIALPDSPLPTGSLLTPYRFEKHDHYARSGVLPLDDEDTSGDEEYYSAEEEESTWDEEESDDVDTEEEEKFLDEIFVQEENDSSEEGQGLCLTPPSTVLPRKTLIEATVGSAESPRDPVARIYNYIPSQFGYPCEPFHRDVDGPVSRKLDNNAASATVSCAVPFAGFPAHSCNCPYCPSNDGCIPTPVQPRLSFVDRDLDVNDETYEGTRTRPHGADDSLDAADLRSARTARREPKRQSTLSSNLLNLADPNHGLKDVTLPPIWRSEQREHQTVVSESVTLPPLRSLDIWYDSHWSRSPIPGLATISRKMALPSILNPSPTSPTNNLSVNKSKLSGSSMTSIDVPAPLIALKEDIFTPDFSSDLKTYSLSFTQNVPMVHPSRDPHNPFRPPPFPGPLRVPLSSTRQRD